MRYVVYVLCGLTVIWLVYLCCRSIMPRLPGQIRVYRVIPLSALITNAVLIIFMLVIAAGATSAGGNAWLITGCLLPLVWMFTGVITKAVPDTVVFSEEKIAVCDLFGPVQTYRWADVSACTVRREEGRGRYSHPRDMYRLTLPDRVLAISNAEDAGRELLQVFERNRPDLKALRQPQR